MFPYMGEIDSKKKIYNNGRQTTQKLLKEYQMRTEKGNLQGDFSEGKFLTDFTKVNGV